MRNIIENLVKETPIAGLSVIVTDYSKNLFEFAYGNVENYNLTINSKIRIASISKLITTLGVMNLVHLEKLNLDSNISDYLDFDLINPNFPNKKITIRQLLSHTSSILDGTKQLYNAPMGTHIREFFVNKDTKYYENGSHFANYEPGSHMNYCNLAFGVVATAIENVSGERFDNFMRNNIFLPLGITADYNVVELSKKPSINISPIYKKLNKNGKWEPQIDTEDFISNHPTNIGYKIGTNGTLYAPQGGVRISAKDLAVLMRTIINGGVPIITKKLLEEMFKPAWILNKKNYITEGEYRGYIRSTGLGTFLISGVKDDLCNDKIWNTISSKNWIGHYGEAYGLISRFIYNQSLRVGIITQCNGISDDTIDKNEVGILTKWEQILFDKIAEKYINKGA